MNKSKESFHTYKIKEKTNKALAKKVTHFDVLEVKHISLNKSVFDLLIGPRNE